jgi:hypothetical protein
MNKAIKIQETIAISLNIAYLLSIIPVLNSFCHVESAQKHKFTASSLINDPASELFGHL